MSDTTPTIPTLDCSAAFFLGEGRASLGAGGSGLRLTTRELIHNDSALARGEDRPLKPIEFVRAQGRIPYDLIGTTYGTLKIVSAEFLAVLKDHGFTGWTTFPVRVIHDAGELGGYEGLAITGRCGAIDDSLSARITIPPPVVGGSAMPGLRGLCFRPESWDGSDLFTSEDGAGVFVVEGVKDALEGAGVTNVQFDRLSEIERMWKSDGSLVEEG